MDQYSVLSEEIKSWERFEYALREEDRLLFSKMLSECKENEDLVRAVNSKDEFYLCKCVLIVLHYNNFTSFSAT
jgi:hypothetical protein